MNIRLVNLKAVGQLTAVFLLIVGMLGLIAACGDDDSSSDSSSSSSPAAADTTADPTATPTAVSDIAAGIRAAPTPTPEGQMPLYGGVLNFNGSGNHRVLDPWHAQGGAGYSQIMMYFNSPIQQFFPYDQSKGVEYEAGLATEWTEAADGSWTLKLREGVTWHDGEAFTADDIVATIDRLLDEEVLLFNKYVPMRNVFSGATKIDDHTVVIHTGGTSNATALAYLSSFLLPIVAEHLIVGDPTSSDVEKRWIWTGPDTTGTLSVGTGPFAMTHWTADVETVGERNENYFLFDEHGNRLPYLDAWVYTAVPDSTRRMARFAAGIADFSLGRGAGIHPEKALELCQGTKDPDGCQVMEFPHGYFNVILNHITTDVWSEPLIVAASRFGPDQDDIASKAYGGRQGFMVMDRGRFPDSAISLEEQAQLLPWSIADNRAEYVQKAKDNLAEAGYPDGLELPQPVFSGGLCSGSFLDQYSRYVDALVEVGINGFLECREGVIANDELEAGRFSINAPGNSINLVNPADGIIKYHLLDSWMVGQGPWRYEGVQEVDAAYRIAVKTSDTTLRMQRYQDIERWMADPKWTVYPALYSTVSMSIHSCIRNFHPGGSWNSHRFAHTRTWMEADSDCRKGHSPYLLGKGID